MRLKIINLRSQESENRVTNYFVNTSDFEGILLKLLKRSIVYAPISENDRIYFEQLTAPAIKNIVYDTAREVDPPKTFFFPAREIMAGYFAGSPEADDRSLVILGVKGCDAAALVVYDRVMTEGGFVDERYKRRRDASLVIGTDCASIWPTCFCTLVGLKPTPEMGVDLNLSTVEDGFLVDVRTEKGNAFYEANKYYFRDATMEEIAESIGKRKKTISMLDDLNKKFDYKVRPHEIIKGTLGSPAWGGITKYCVECGACNIACPSCTCFMLRDRRARSGYERDEVWDACLKGSYGRVAGGANSRPILSQRYNNRLQCKFDYSFDRLNMYTCTGCGRCIETCPARIDMREALKTLERALALSVKLE